MYSSIIPGPHSLLCKVMIPPEIHEFWGGCLGDICMGLGEFALGTFARGWAIFGLSWIGLIWPFVFHHKDLFARSVTWASFAVLRQLIVSLLGAVVVLRGILNSPLSDYPNIPVRTHSCNNCFAVVTRCYASLTHPQTPNWSWTRHLASGKIVIFV